MTQHLKSSLLALLILFLFSGHASAPAPCLCKANEKNVYSFSTLKSKKIVSVCAEKNGKYLVYRYGLPNKIELTFPTVLDQTSWKGFSYSGYTRGGGPMNAAVSDQTLSFTNKDATYDIYDHSGYADTTEESYSQEAGIMIRVKGKEYDSKADPGTISGSLERLRDYENIENHFGE